VAEADILRKLVDICADEASSADLKTKSTRALKMILQKCTHLTALEPLLENTPEKIVKYVVQQFAKVLPHDPAARKSFVRSGSLKRVQELEASDDDGKLQEYVELINSCFPPEIVQYYSRAFLLDSSFFFFFFFCVSQQITATLLSRNSTNSKQPTEMQPVHKKPVNTKSRVCMLSWKKLQRETFSRGNGPNFEFSARFFSIFCILSLHTRVFAVSPRSCVDLCPGLHSCHSPSFHRHTAHRRQSTATISTSNRFADLTLGQAAVIAQTRCWLIEREVQRTRKDIDTVSEQNHRTRTQLFQNLQQLDESLAAAQNELKTLQVPPFPPFFALFRHFQRMKNKNSAPNWIIFQLKSKNSANPQACPLETFERPPPPA
jgi:hypothetical protein